MSNKVEINGLTFIMHNLCLFGDYAGTGSVGRANVAYLKDNLKWIDVPSWKDEYLVDSEVEMLIKHEAYGTTICYIREDLFPEYETRLDNYPLLCEDTHSAIAMELEQEAWEDYGAKDFLKDLTKQTLDRIGDEETREAVELIFESYDRDNDDLWLLFQEGRYLLSGDESRMDGDQWYFANDDVIEGLFDRTDFLENIVDYALEIDVVLMGLARLFDGLFEVQCKEVQANFSTQVSQALFQ